MAKKEISQGDRRKIENRARLALGVPADTKMAWVGSCRIWHGFGCMFVSRVILREDNKPNVQPNIKSNVQSNIKHVAVCLKCLKADKVPPPH